MKGGSPGPSDAPLQVSPLRLGLPASLCSCPGLACCCRLDVKTSWALQCPSTDSVSELQGQHPNRCFETLLSYTVGMVNSFKSCILVHHSSAQSSTLQQSTECSKVQVIALQLIKAQYSIAYYSTVTFQCSPVQHIIV